MAPSQRSADLEETLLWITTGSRVFAALWLSILGSVVLAGRSEEVERPGVVVATMATVLLWAGAATVLRVLRPKLASHWAFVAVDLALSAWTVVAGTVAGSIQFAGGYPLAGAFAAIYAFGATGGIVSAVVLTAAGLVPVLGTTQSFSQEVANALAFLFSVGAAVGVAGVLRSSEHRRIEAEAALTRERAERVRAEERAEVATHLHDSVLQTLALIQRDQAATADIRGLARYQERELRAWLFPDVTTDAGAAGGFREALIDAGSEIEDRTGTRVDTVVVGNLLSQFEPIVRAAREAILNAATHAGVETVSVYGEANAEEVLVFVKDRGRGFDPGAIDPSRHGVSESIVGRMQRYGGSAEIISAPGSGTEVRLRFPMETR